MKFDDLMLKVKEFEGFRDTSYLCPSGVRTIGYGFTYPGGACPLHMSRATAHFVLRDRLLQIMSDLRNYVFPFDCYEDVFAVNSWYEDVVYAFCDFIYNCGMSAFKRNFPSDKISPTSFDADFVCSRLKTFVYSNKKLLPGLVSRRDWEVSVIMAAYSDKHIPF